MSDYLHPATRALGAKRMAEIMANEKGFACVESMTRVKCGDFHVVRVWRDESHACDVYDNSDIKELVRRALGWSPARLVKALAALPRVSAVEVTDVVGDGVVVYKEWP